MLRLFGLYVVAGLLALTPGSVRAGDGFFDSNGVKIHYVVQGQGVPVVLLHGFTLNSYLQWDLPGITRALAQTYQVINMDCRGHGRSGKPRDPKLYGKEMAEDVVRLLDHLQIKKAHLVGYSMGAFIVLNLLATHPDRMLTATVGGAGWTDKIDGKFLDEVADSLSQGKGIGPLVRRLTPKGYPPPTDNDVRQVNQFTALINDVKALAAAFRSLRELSFAEQVLKTNEVPTLVLVGNLDPLKDDVDLMATKMANLTVVVIPNADHVDAFTKPQFIAGLKAFLSNPPPVVSVKKPEPDVFVPDDPPPVEDVRPAWRPRARRHPFFERRRYRRGGCWRWR